MVLLIKCCERWTFPTGSLPPNKIPNEIPPGQIPTAILPSDNHAAIIPPWTTITRTNASHEIPPKNLYKLCSVCGGWVVTKLGYVNAKTCSDYIDLLRTCFGILTSENKEVKIWIHSNIHGVPPKLWEAFWLSKIFMKEFGGIFVWKWAGEGVICGGITKKYCKRGGLNSKKLNCILVFLYFLNSAGFYSCLMLTVFSDVFIIM